MKITKRQLRRIIQEESSRLLNESAVLVGPNSPEAPIPLRSRAHPMIRSMVAAGRVYMDECDMQDDGMPLATTGIESIDMPCPHETAAAVSAAGASPDEVMTWIGTFLQDYSDQSPMSATVDHTGDLNDLSAEEAFGLGYSAGAQGL
tara:strand:- start:955 stop:1395 length:441 start_codon:yes stop_codon:yes gene_type:complete